MPAQSDGIKPSFQPSRPPACFLAWLSCAILLYSYLAFLFPRLFVEFSSLSSFLLCAIGVKIPPKLTSQHTLSQVLMRSTLAPRKYSTVRQASLQSPSIPEHGEKLTENKLFLLFVSWVYDVKPTSSMIDVVAPFWARRSFEREGCFYDEDGVAYLVCHGLLYLTNTTAFESWSFPSHGCFCFIYILIPFLLHFIITFHFALFTALLLSLGQNLSVRSNSPCRGALGLDGV